MAKKIKTQNLDPNKMYTKSAYAKKIKTNPMQVQRMIDRKELVVVIVNGSELIHI